jgi:anti-sigma regulatory factor (Ser/Thr protein kinase)
MSELYFKPIKGRVLEILKAIQNTPEMTSCSREVVMILRLACEEVVMNIASYAYPDDEEGFIEVEIDKKDDRIVIIFKDGGVPFNPKDHEMPDTKLPLEQRRIGGLGIFLVISKMDDVRYAYVDNKNVLTIEKKLGD